MEDKRTERKTDVWTDRVKDRKNSEGGREREKKIYQHGSAAERECHIQVRPILKLVRLRENKLFLSI